MTTPTQAQIEAAGVAYWNYYRQLDGNKPEASFQLDGDFAKAIAAAITAAAQVDDHPSMVCPDCGVVHSWPSNQCSTCAVKLVPFAVAQVGEKPFGAGYTKGYAEGFKYAEKDTIERCAQVAKARADFWNEKAKIGAGDDCSESLADECEDIFAAIRKLKDAPPVDPNIIRPGKDPDFTFPEEDQ